MAFTKLSSIPCIQHTPTRQQASASSPSSSFNIQLQGVHSPNSHDATVPPSLTPLYASPLPFPSPSNGGSGVEKNFGIKDARRWVLEHFGHKNQHLYKPGFLTGRCIRSYRISIDSPPLLEISTTQRASFLPSFSFVAGISTFTQLSHSPYIQQVRFISLPVQFRTIITE